MQTITYRMMDKILLYSTGNYIQYPMINHNGKEYFKMCTYLCVCVYIYIYIYIYMYTYIYNGIILLYSRN